MDKATVEGLKEAARVFVTAAVTYFFSIVSSGLDFNWKAVAIGAAVAGIKGLDKWINKNDKLPATGLLPF